MQPRRVHTRAASSSGAILRSISQGSAGFAGMQPDNMQFFLCVCFLFSHEDEMFHSQATLRGSSLIFRGNWSRDDNKLEIVLIILLLLYYIVIRREVK